MAVLTNWNYLEILKNFPKTHSLLMNEGIREVEKLDSLWRKENLLLRIKTQKNNYVFKQIKGDEKQLELSRFKLLKKEYPSLFPNAFMFEKESYLMNYIDGCSFFNLKKKEKSEKVNLAGKLLRKAYCEKSFEKKDISESVFASFNKYREKRKRFFLEDELILDYWYFEDFREVKQNPSHNDLNAANLLYSESIKLIDPSDEGFNDISRDIGRYCASCFFNNYDYFGGDKKHSLDIAEAFLCNFDEDLLNRAKYFIGESFLSFLNFDTVSVSKATLKKLAVDILLKKGKITKILEESLQ